MKFCIHVNNHSSHQKYHTNLMRKSLIKDGMEEVDFKNADFYVTWAWKPRQTNSRWQALEKTGKPVLVMERGYIGDRMNEWTSVGWNGLNGRADFCNQDITDVTRFNTNFSKYILPWKYPDENLPVLVIGQCYHDASVSHTNINTWYDKVIKQLLDNGNKVIFRAHPLNKKIPYNSPVPIDKNEKLEKTLNQVKAVVTFNSNSGVEAILNGIPTYSEDIGSMVYNVSSHDLNNLEYKPDRQDWCVKMSYTQWSDNEIESGKTWQHLKRKIIQ